MSGVPECDKRIYAKLSLCTDKRGSYTSFASNRHTCKKADGTPLESHSFSAVENDEVPEARTIQILLHALAAAKSVLQSGDALLVRALWRYHAQTCAGERSDLMVEKCLFARCLERQAQDLSELKACRSSRPTALRVTKVTGNIRKELGKK
jgi:hypothetical protein